MVNYELPNVPEDYVHRIGRTARAGGTGCAVSLVSPDESPLLRDIERMLRRQIPVTPMPEFKMLASPPQGAPRPARRTRSSLAATAAAAAPHSANAGQRLRPASALARSR